MFYRPQDEYCEWRVTRDEQGRIVKITFTSEPPEYWQALHGDTIADANNDNQYKFAGDKKLLLQLYREYVSPDVQLEDLECSDDLVDLTDPRNPSVVYAKGQYNPYNRWNTTGGIMHLTHPANTLQAEVNLGAVATVLYQAYERPVSDPEALILAAAFGGPNRHQRSHHRLNGQSAGGCGRLHHAAQPSWASYAPRQSGRLRDPERRPCIE